MFKQLVTDILTSYQDNPTIEKIGCRNSINKATIIEILDNLQMLLFPGFFGQKCLTDDSLEYCVGALIENIAYNLNLQIQCALWLGDLPGDEVEENAERVTFEFLHKIPNIRQILATDLEAFYAGDPAAYNFDEIIQSYPGFYALAVNRMAHELYNMGIPLIPRIMTEHAHSLTGIDINPGATIGHHFFIDHGTGIVIGETTVIGNYVKIYQGVTLGALSTRGGQSLKGRKRHPTIEDYVTIYAGASILGGDTVIGEGVTINSNVFITDSVQDNTRVSIKNQDLVYTQRRKTAHAEEIVSPAMPE